MASAKFLEEALSTDVDESAVSAIVGSLETQLVAGPQQTAAPSPAPPGLGASLPQTPAQPQQQQQHAPAAVAAVVAAPAAPQPQSQPQAQPQAQPQLQLQQQQPATAAAAGSLVQPQQQQQPQSNGASAATTTAPGPAPPTSLVVPPALLTPVPAPPKQQQQQQSQTQAPQQQPQPQHVANGTVGPEASSGDGGGGGNGAGPQLQLVNSVSGATPAQEQQQQQQAKPLTPTTTSTPVHTPTPTPAPTPPSSAVGPIQVVSVPVQAMVQQQQQHQQTVQAVQTVQTVGQQQQQQQQQPQPQQVQQQQQFVGQVTSNQVTSNQSAQLTALAKVQGEHVKIVYPGSGQVIATTGVVNANSKLTFPAQSVAQLANGTLGVVTSQAVLQSTSNTASIASGTQTTNQATINVNKPTTLVIKTSVAPGGMVSLPMSVPVTVAANMTNTAQQGKAGVTSGIVPSNLQLVNVNAMRPGTPVTGQQAGKQVGSRVVIGQQMMGGRAGTPGITLQTLQSLQGSGPGTLLLKTENGQYQLVRIGPPPTQGTPGGTVTPSNITANTVVASPGTGTTYRLASLPATVAPTVTTTTVTPVTSTIMAATTTAPTPASIPTQTTPAPAQVKRQTTDNTKEKCRKFLANLLQLSSREPKHVERCVRTLIQELIDAKVEPEEFCVRLEKLLNASPQPCLIGFLKKSLPLLRQSLVTKELVIEGIRPPPANVVFSIASTTPVVSQQNQIRPTVAVAPAGASIAPPLTQVVASPASVAVTPTATTQVRVVAPLTGVTNVPRPSQSMLQQRLVPPVTTLVRPPMATYSKAPTIQQQSQPLQQPPQLQPQQQHIQQQQQPQPQPPPLHPTQPPQLQPMSSSVSNVNVSTGTSTIRHPPPIIVQKSVPMTTASKTILSAQNKSVTTSASSNKAAVPSLMTKPSVIKEKEKKTFSSAGYTGDDDINDVAAMGGVNLAEESQRILGSTKFVGTQIRSCKDEVFLHMTPLQQKINKIVTSYGLEEPNQEVASLISHAAQERLKNLVEKLAIIAEHRIDLVKVDPRYEVTQDVRAQLKFLEELDRVERKRHEEQERETLLKAAKSRAKTEDPEQAKLKAKAKEMQRAEMEEARQREANQTALQAIGPRKKPKLDLGAAGANNSGGPGGLSSLGTGLNRQMPLRPRLKRVNFRDLLFLLEQEKETCRSTTLYKSYLK